MPRYHFTAGQLDDIKARYASGETSNSISEDYGCSGQTITRLAKELGVHEPRRRGPRSRYSLQAKQDMAKRYESGESLASIAKDYDCHPGNIRFLLLGQDVELRKTGRPSIPEWRLEWIRKQRESGATYVEIADKLDLQPQHIRALCRKRIGLPPAKRDSGAQHHAWKGGRITNHHSGYVYVFVEPDDPLYCMATANGYAPEHRIVIARTLGRPLRKDETVHHLDGDKANNAIGNLQLRQGNHGKGIVMTCNTCGSHDIRPVEIADPTE